MIPIDVIQVLIQIGIADDLNDLTTLQRLEAIAGFDAINRTSWQEWDEITRPLQTDDLVALTKGLTLTEKHHRWIGGSVAAAIWTFRELRRREPTLADELADWILPRTSNPWVPFGSQNHGARSVEEYRNAQQQRNERIHAGIANLKVSEDQAITERELRSEQRKRSSRDRESEIRIRLIAELAQLTIEQQLRRIAADTTYTLGFYPTCIADAATESVLQSLDEETRIELLRKLKGKKRGPWNCFKRRLLLTFPLYPWDRSGWFHPE